MKNFMEKLNQKSDISVVLALPRYCRGTAAVLPRYCRGTAVGILMYDLHLYLLIDILENLLPVEGTHRIRSRAAGVGGNSRIILKFRE